MTREESIALAESRLQAMNKCHCSCGASGKLRVPDMEDWDEAKRMAYVACDSCFNRTWEGEA